MKDVKILIAKRAAEVAKKFAVVAAGSASCYYLHQPKEPANISKLKKRKDI